MPIELTALILLLPSARIQTILHMTDSRIPGFATTEGTERFRDRFPELGGVFNTLGTTGLLCSPIGFGTYRCDVRIAEHRAAMAKAIRMGVNLIDTSANYANGNSERLIGEVLTLLISAGEITREEIILVSKGGYIQGENFERISVLADDEAADISPGSEYSELVRYGKGLWHSIHPAFLEDQISRSLERLSVETLDVYLLHNPEYYIQSAIKDGIPEDEARDTYEERIIRAFVHLETEVQSGRIKQYGISSNTFPKPEDSVDRTALEHIWIRTQAVIGEKNHFGIIQFPMNLYERGGLFEQNQEKSTISVIEFARHKGMAMLINRPLNAFTKNTLVRLADYPEREFPPIEEINELVHDLTLQEQEFKNGPLKDISLTPEAYEGVKKLLSLGEWLEGKWEHLSSFEEWRDLLFTVLKPRLQYVFDILRPAVAESKEIFGSLQQYAESIDVLMEHITNFYTTKAHERSALIHHALDDVLSLEYREISLSQKAVLMLRSIEGISSVLVGMRSDEYVDDTIYGLQANTIENAGDVWKRLDL